MRQKEIFWTLMLGAVLSLLTTQFTAQNPPAPANFSGMVISKADGSALAMAHYWVHDDSGRRTWANETDNSGHFALQLPNGSYNVMFSKEAFQPYSKRIRIDFGTPVSLRVALDKDKESAAK